MMTPHKIWNLLKRLLLAALLTVPLAGCLELDEEASTVPVVSAVPDVAISGSVGDGPVVGATITVYSNSGEVLGSMVSDSTATFRSTLKVRGNQYPLRLVVSGGTDLVTGTTPDFEMVSVMLSPSNRQVNINPFTTLIVMLAEKMPGGLSSNNVDAARPIVLEKLGFGLNSNMIADPVTTEITAENVANLVKSSEAAGEMVRRTRDLLVASGKNVSANSVLAALAADLTDGVVDGLGGVGSNPTVASVANVVSAQVLVETICNRLRVWGVIATATLDQSIFATRSGVNNSQLTGGVAVTGQLLEQARIALVAAQVLDSGSDMMGIAAAVAGLTPGSLPDEVVTMLPAESSLVLVNAVNQVATASSSDVAAINQVVASNGDTTPLPLPPPVNTPPVISGSPAGSVTANNSYVFQPSASDSDGDSLTFSIASMPSWASFNTSTGRLSGTPSAADARSYNGIVIAATDGTDTASLAAFSIRVDMVVVPNTAPIISGSPSGSVAAGSSYVFQPSASDSDGDSLTFSIANMPSWASFDTRTGRLSGTPSAADARSYNGIVIAATDGTDTASLAAFSIRVDMVVVPNTAPIISGSPSGSVDAGSSYVFQPTASDSDGDSLTFSIANMPSWASFNAASGRLSGIPANGDARTYGNILISVSDGTDTVSLGAFSVTVVAVNTAPSINGTPAGSVDAGSSYVFQPTASDSDGDSLTFSIANMPSWASFDTSTGRLSGTPSAADARSYNGIVIAATDGTDSASLGAFSIQVNPAPVLTSSMSVSWVPPVERADGTPLTLSDIDGYRLYYGTTPGNYPNSVDIPDGTASSATISDLPLGSYYVVMSTYDTSGLEGEQSAPVIKSVQ